MKNISNDHNQTRVVLLINEIDLLSVHALQQTKSISENITAFSVVINEEARVALSTRWNNLELEIPYVIRIMPDHRIVEPLLELIHSFEHDYAKDDTTVVIIPQLVVRKWRHKLLHHDASVYVERLLLKHKNIIVVMMPFQLIDDKVVLKSGISYN